MIGSGLVIYNALSTDPELSGIVGDKIYPNSLPQKVDPPFIIYEILASQATHTQDQTSHLREQLQVLAVGSDQDQTFELAESVTRILNFYEGTVGNATIDYATFQGHSDVFWGDPRYPVRELSFNVLSTITKT